MLPIPYGCWEQVSLSIQGIFPKKVYGQLVLLGYDVTAFTPAAYQRSSLLRPLMEISS
jgi:hypothetical protein